MKLLKIAVGVLVLLSISGCVNNNNIGGELGEPPLPNDNKLHVKPITTVKLPAKEMVEPEKNIKLKHVPHF